MLLCIGLASPSKASFLIGYILILKFGSASVIAYSIYVHNYSVSKTMARNGSSELATLQGVATSGAITPSAESSTLLPAFRSTQEFPRRPNADRLPALYSDCMQALLEANNARSILKGRMEGKKRAISAIRLEIDRLEQDLALEAGARARLHAMNLRLVKALYEMDGLVGDLDQVVLEAHRVPRSRLGRLIDRLKALAHQWQAFKRRQQQELASLEGSQQNGGRTCEKPW